MAMFTEEEIQRFKEIFQVEGMSDECFNTVIVNGSYNFENELCKYADKITKDQLIKTDNWRYMFQSGTPHYSWNTDRYSLVCSILDMQHAEKVRVKKYSETWYEVTETWYKCDNMNIKVKVEAPRTIDGSYHHYYSVVEDKDMPARADTGIAKMRIDRSTGQLYIVDQFQGTLGECQIWESKNTDSDSVFHYFHIELN